MARSKYKGPFILHSLLEKVQKLIVSGKTTQPIKTYSRSSTIIPLFLGLTFLVYNGKQFIPVHIVDSMIGHKLGEFSPTRKFNGHSGDRKVNKK